MHARKPNVYLIGPMGSGKTTIGSRAAPSLGMRFIDLDSELEERTGASVNLIYDVEGEEGFRERESRLLAEIAELESCLVATGGGSVLRAVNREVMNRSGVVVYLKTSVKQQLSRLRQDKKRPLLQAPDREKKLEELASQRNPIYEGMADLVFPSQNRNPARVAKHLANSIKSYLDTT